MRLALALFILICLVFFIKRRSFLDTLFPDDMPESQRDLYYGSASDLMNSFKNTTSTSGMYTKRIKKQDRVVNTGIDRPTNLGAYSLNFLENGKTI